MPTEEVNWQERYNAHFIVRVRVRLLDVPGTLGSLLAALGETQTHIGDISIVGADGRSKIRDVLMFFSDQAHMDSALATVRKVEDLEVLSTRDEVLESHRLGVIETRSRVKLDSIMDLRMVYTPGVASVCNLISERPEAAWEYTGIARRIAIVTNGTAVLGLGDIGALAGLPVMEGKAAILAEFVDVWAEPVLIDSKDPDEIIDIVSKIHSNFGAIQLEDIAAPSCFEVEEKLQARLDKPVFHDDQHGTATVCLAGLINALKKTNRRAENCRAVILGAGAAGSAIARLLVEFGLNDVVLCDSKGAIYEGRPERMDPWKQRWAKITNRENLKGDVATIMKGRDLFIGVSRPKMVTPEMVRSMAADPIVFALANPVSEISVQDALEAGAAVAMDGRGMNNALAFPGIFRGALDVQAKRITHEMKVAAAFEIADSSGDDEILPDMLDRDLHFRVAAKVAQAWEKRDKN